MKKYLFIAFCNFVFHSQTLCYSKIKQYEILEPKHANTCPISYFVFGLSSLILGFSISYTLLPDLSQTHTQFTTNQPTENLQNLDISTLQKLTQKNISNN